MSKLIVLISGPPQSGKSTAASILRTKMGAVVCHPMQGVDKAISHLFHIDPDIWNAVLKGDKDIPERMFTGYSIRQVEIALADWMERNFGESIFPDQIIQRIRSENNPSILYVIPSVKNDSDMEVYTQVFGVKNVMLLRLEREGTTWSNDSRVHVQPFVGQHHKDIINKYDMEMFEVQITNAVDKWMGSRI